MAIIVVAGLLGYVLRKKGKQVEQSSEDELGRV